MPQTRVFLLRSILGHQVLFIVLTSLFCFVFFSFGREVVRSREIEQDIARLQAEAQALSERQTELTQWQNTLQTEGFIEREARIKLGLKKPGEQVIIVQPVPQNSGVDSGDSSLYDLSTHDTTSRSNPSKWWWYFFGQTHGQ